MNPREIVMEQIHHHETFPVPFALDFEGDVAERLDIYYGGTSWRERLTPYLKIIEGVDTILEKPVSDAHTRDAFGSIWRHDLRPMYLTDPALKIPSFNNYKFPDLDIFWNEARRKKVVQELENYSDSFRIVLIPWGLFEQSWRIRGFENALIDAISEPDFYQELIHKLTELYLKFVHACGELDCDAIMFGDDWGDQRGVILGPDRWRKFLKPCWQEIYAAVHAYGKFAITHSCGSVADIMTDLIEIGLDVLESVQPEAAGMNPYQLKAQWGDNIVFWGCLGSQSTIPFCTPGEIKAEVQKLCNEMGKGGGYILSPAKSLQPETRTENAVAVVKAFTNQGEYLS
ncbi:MAG TPA: uroporphyrinogen decarboxylase family protein [bacterium]